VFQFPYRVPAGADFGSRTRLEAVTEASSEPQIQLESLGHLESKAKEEKKERRERSYIYSPEVGYVETIASKRGCPLEVAPKHVTPEPDLSAWSWL
jgi:hypothetical protein